MGLLCLNFKVQAQDNKAVDVTLKGIQIGQKVPDITISNLHNYKDANGKPATTAKLSDFKGKLLILDFWATWCSPCVAMIPKMDSLQKSFGDKIQFLSVTYQTEKEVLPFLEKFEKQRGKHYDLPVVTADKELHRLFPHVYLPHYVWIDGDGIVKGITEKEQVNANSIHDMLQAKVSIISKEEKVDIYDQSKQMSENLNYGDNIIYSSTLTGYARGIASNFSVRTDSLNGRKLTLTNVPLMWLYRMAFGGSGFIGKNRISIKLATTSNFWSELKGEAYRKWLEDGNGYCYRLQVPFYARNEAYSKMKDDLAMLFPMYEARTEIQQKEVFALVRTSSVDKLSSKEDKYVSRFDINGIELRNTYLIELIYKLNSQYQQRSSLPIIDQTAFKGKIDLSIEANLSNMDQINTALQAYDLKFIKKVVPLEVLVIKDKVVKDIKEGR